MMNFHIITIFPEMFAALKYGIIGRALTAGIINVTCFNPRTYCEDKNGRIDDRPYGGGPGMVMEAEPLQKAIEAARKSILDVYSEKSPLVIYLTPQGKLLNQEIVAELSMQKNLILLSGRYEGIDERLIESDVDMELSIGDYVLSGGEFPAMVLIDSITRTLPEALGDEASAKQDSFYHGLLDYPHYTRPEKVAQRVVPKVLLSGNHETIARWRLKQALGRTWLRRPDLLKKRQLTNEETMLLNEFINENEN